MKRINVTAKKWKFPPFFQAILLSVIPLTKSNTHSMKFCFPVGRFFKFRVQTIAKIKTKIAVITTIKTLAKLKTISKPKTFQLTSGDL